MNSRIELTKTLSDAQDKLLFGWAPDVFELDPYGLQWRIENDWHYLLYLDEKLISHVGIVKQTIQVGDLPITVGGIGGVITLPEFQGKGYARILISEATKFICEELQVEFGLLFCRPVLVRFYAKLGWRPVTERVLVDQPNGKVELTVQAMFLPCHTEVWPDGLVDIGCWPW